MSTDAEARRSLRIAFNAWGDAQPLGSVFCPGTGPGQGDEVLWHGYTFSPNNGNTNEYLQDTYCQEALQYDAIFDPSPGEYLNESIFVTEPPDPDEDEPGLALKIGLNNDPDLANRVTAIRYSFLNDDRFDDPSGMQWAFYFFPGDITLVTLYGRSTSPQVLDENQVRIWDGIGHDFDREYLCFNGGTYVGLWDGEPAGTEPLDGCQPAPPCHELTAFHTGSGRQLLLSPQRSPGCADSYYHEGEVISITANPASGGEIEYWLGTDDDSGTSHEKQLTKAAEPEFVSVHYFEPRVCPAGSTETQWLDEDMESGEGDWSHFATQGEDTWMLVTDKYLGPTTSWKGHGWASDALSLVSPPVLIPAAATDVVLSFFQDLDGFYEFGNICRDGATLEYSSNGTDWIVVSAERFLENPYLAPIDDPSNELQFRDAWCGTIPWHRVRVDLSGHEGQTLEFRFRMANSSVDPFERIWHIDDVTVSGCMADEPANTLRVKSVGAEDVTVNSPTGHDGVTDYRISIEDGQAVTLEAPLTWDDSHFDGWAGCDSTVNLTCSLTMLSDRTVEASYIPNCFSLSLSYTGCFCPGSDLIATPAQSNGCPAGSYTAGETIQLAANPSAGYQVSGWTGSDDDQSLSSTNQLTMPASHHVIYSHFYFPTQACPGEVSEVWFDGNMVTGWSHFADVGEDEWARETNEWIGRFGWHGPDFNPDNDPPPFQEARDQSLVSPAVTIPATAISAVLDFEHWYELESCEDGAVLEYSTNAGTDWSPFSADDFQSEGYNGTIDSLSNPLNSREAWCGGTEDPIWTSLDLTSLAAETLNFRFRYGTDNQETYDGWWILDMEVEGCVALEEDQFRLDVYSSGSSANISSSTGQGGTPPYNRSVASGANVVLEAGGSNFSHWNGCTTSSGTTCNVTMTANTSVYANHVPSCYALNLGHSGSGADPVASPPNSSECVRGQYRAYTPVTLLAEPDDGWEVAGWTSPGESANAKPRHELRTFENDISTTVHYVESLTCPVGANKQVLFFEDNESGEGSWTHFADAGPDAWALSTADFYSPENAWFLAHSGEPADQSLVSPQVVIPAHLAYPTLSFYGWRRFRSFDVSEGFGCWDGGVLEYSIDGGSNWLQLDASRILGNFYDGKIEPSANPLEDNRDAWCGFQTWQKTAVDLSGLQGQSLNFRWRVGSYSSGQARWYIDDIQVSSCLRPELIYIDGFELP